MKKKFGVLIILIAIVFILKNLTIVDNHDLAKNIVEPVFEYGIRIDTFKIIRGSVKQGQTIGEIFYSNHIDHPEINKIAHKSKAIFDVRRITAGNKYIALCLNDSIDKLQYLIYEKDPINYIVFDLVKDIYIYSGKKEIVTKRKIAKSEITSSLSLTMESKKLSPRLTHELSTIYAWTIDFFKIQEGDAFKIYYEDRYVDGKYIGIGKILASEFKHRNKKYYAFYYKENENFSDYYDENGKTLRKAFLMAPVDYKRISSRYSTNRKHPVTGRWKGHFGTDYAAEKGTPIWATADGKITRASYTKNNGNYVKIKHNNTYTTQYLHMSKIKPGIKKGVYVKQGDIIGYVGSTGLATGPHVCYRFWKNGKQVDPFKQKLPPGDPIKKENYNDFILVKDSLYSVLIK